MRVDWNINYKDRTAVCSQLRVYIIELPCIGSVPPPQIVGGMQLQVGFEKEAHRMFYCFVLSISDIIISNIEDDPDLIANYMRQLGDEFNAHLYDTLGQMPKDVDLSRYLGVARSTVSNYDKKKKELMKLGLKLKGIS